MFHIFNTHFTKNLRIFLSILENFDIYIKFFGLANNDSTIDYSYFFITIAFFLGPDLSS